MSDNAPAPREGDAAATPHSDPTPTAEIDPRALGARRPIGEVDWQSPLPLARQTRGLRRVLPSRTDAIAHDFSQFLGGPVGRHAVLGRQRFFTPLRMIFLVALVFLALGWGTKAACVQQAPDPQTGKQELSWPNNRQFVALCYSDIIPLYSAHHLNDLMFPYFHSWTDEALAKQGKPATRYMEYPVLTGLFMYGSAVIASPFGGKLGLPVAVFFGVCALLLAMCWLIAIWATWLSAGRRGWWVMLMAASPLVIVHAFTNFDALAVAALAVALLCWSREKPAWAGFFIGVGVALKLYPLLALVVLLALALRTNRVREAATTVGAAVVTWLVINAPFMIGAYNGWAEFFRRNNDRGLDPDTLYNIVAKTTGYNWRTERGPDFLNAISLGLFVLVCLAVVALALWAPRRPRVAQLLFLIVAGFLLVNKVWSPQYSLWLVPLAVLAIARTRTLLAWMAFDALLWIPRLYGVYLGEGAKYLPVELFYTAVVVRDFMILGLCALVVYNILVPDSDPVRRAGDDDPLGGPFALVPDYGAASGFSGVTRRSRAAAAPAISTSGGGT